MLHARSASLSCSRDIPFNKLVLSQSNVRHVKVGISIEQLAESIAQRTLLQSLNVRAVVDADGNETGMFEVLAGGRRYRALDLLVKKKRMAKTQAAPCVVREAGIAKDSRGGRASSARSVPILPVLEWRRVIRRGYRGSAFRDTGHREATAPAGIRVAKAARGSIPKTA